MATNHGHGGHGAGSGAGQNPGVEYDKSDLNARDILIFLFVLAMFAVIIHLAVLGLYVGMTRIAEKHDPEPNPLAPQTYTPRDEILTNTANVNIQQFPEPRLLHHVRGSGEMTKFLLEESAVLTARPWQDAQGNVHLPIDQAMKTVATRLPVRAGGAGVPNYPGAAREYAYPTAPGESEAEQSTGTHDASSQNASAQHASTQSSTVPGEVTPGEAGNSTAGK